jgi:carboxypeptidase C (cathepsin A)
MSNYTRAIFLTNLFLLPLAASPILHAQETHEKQTTTVEKDKPAEPAPPTPKEDSSVTDHTVKIGAQTVPYKATAATILLKNEKEEPTALIYYTAYTRTDAKDTSQRPIAFIYNGGPGSASVWLHMGAFGPRRVDTANAEPTPPPPYRVVDNTNSLIEVADLVFIDPVGTGFSKAVGKAKNKDFWGIDSGREIPRPIHQHLRQPQQPLELTQVSHRGKLRHLPQRRAGQLSQSRMTAWTSTVSF